MKTYKPTDACKKCGGDCCKNYSGIFWPQDIRPLNPDKIADMLKSGLYVIDWLEGGSKFIRPKHKKDSSNRGIHEPSWGGECVFLTEKGCSLPRKQRPLMCRALKPSDDGVCTSELRGKYGASKAWSKFQSIIREAEKLATITENKI